MAAAKYNLVIEQGANFSRTITLRDGAGALLSLTGWTMRGQIRASQSAVAALQNFACVISDQVTNEGEAVISLNSVETAALPVPTQTSPTLKNATYIYDIEAVRPSGEVLRLMQGTVTVVPEATK